MAQDTQKPLDAEANGATKRGPGRPKGSVTKHTANAVGPASEAKEGAVPSRSADASMQDAMEELRGSVDVGFEMLHEHMEKLQEVVRSLTATIGEKAVYEAATKDLKAEIKRLSESEQWKGQHLEQWTRVMVELPGADRRRYWRIMRAVYGSAVVDNAPAATRRAMTGGTSWWHIGLLAILIAMALYGVMYFVFE